MLSPPATGLQIGGLDPHTGHGVVRVDGPGSRIDATAPGQFPNVGRFGDGSVGDLSITNADGKDVETVVLSPAAYAKSPAEWNAILAAYGK